MNVCISNLFFFEFLLILKSNNGHIGQSNPIYDHFFQYLRLSRWSLLERCRYSLWVIFSILSYWRTRVNTPAEKSLLRFCSLSLSLSSICMTNEIVLFQFFFRLCTVGMLSDIFLKYAQTHMYVWKHLLNRLLFFINRLVLRIYVCVRVCSCPC